MPGKKKRTLKKKTVHPLPKLKSKKSTHSRKAGKDDGLPTLDQLEDRMQSVHAGWWHI